MSYRDTYVEQAIRTAPPTDYVASMPNINRNMRLLLGAIGMVGESIEVLEAAMPFLDGDEFEFDKSVFIKECGDVTWYAALIADLEGTTFDLLLMDEHDAVGLARLAVQRFNRRVALRDSINIMLVKAKNVSERIKKQVFHLHGEDRLALVDDLRELVHSIQVVGWVVGVDIETILRVNIEKLWKRYPERFAPDRSMNREEGDA